MSSVCVKNPVTGNDYALTDDESCTSDDRNQGLMSLQGAGGAGNSWLLSLLNFNRSQGEGDPHQVSLLDYFSQAGTRHSLLEGSGQTTDTGFKGGLSAYSMDGANGDSLDLINVGLTGDHVTGKNGSDTLSGGLDVSLAKEVVDGNTSTLLPIGLSASSTIQPDGTASGHAQLAGSLFNQNNKDGSGYSLLPVQLGSSNVLTEDGGIQQGFDASGSILSGQSEGGTTYSVGSAKGNLSVGTEGFAVSGSASVFDLSVPLGGKSDPNSDMDAAAALNLSVGPEFKYENHEGDMDGDGHDEQGELLNFGVGDIGMVTEHQDIDGDGEQDWVGHVGMGPLQFGAGDKDGDGVKDYTFGIDLPFLGKNKDGDGSKSKDGSSKNGDGQDVDGVFTFTVENPMQHLENGYNWVKDGVVGGYNKVSELASDGYDGLKDGVVSGYNTVKDGVVDTYNGAKDTVVGGYNATKEWIGGFFD